MTDLLGPASAPNAVTARLAEYRSFGTVDTWFKPCSNPASQDGTQVQAAWLNGIMAQLRGAIRGNGNLASGAGPVVPEVNTVDGLLLGAIQLLIARGQPNAGTDTGSADALAVAPATPWPEYVKGARLWVIKSTAAGPNATTAPTLAVSSLAPVTIVRRDGSALLPGDLPAGVAFPVEYDGTFFRLVSLTWGEIAAAVQSGKWLYGVATGVANAATVQLVPQQAPVDGTEILVKWPGVNTVAAPTFLFVGTTVKTPVRQGGGTIQPGDLSGYVPFIYDATLATWRVNGLVLSDILALGGVVRVTDAAGASTAQILSGTASPAVSAYSPSQIIIFTAAANNTGANPTLAVTGAGGLALGTLTIVKKDASALAQGDLLAGATYIGSPDATGSRLRLFGQLPSDVSAAAVVNTVSRNYQSFTSSTTFPVPAGVTAIRMWGHAPGGPGGGGNGTGAGSGGSGGEYADCVLPVVPAETLTITIGALGTPGNPGYSGTASGTTSVKRGSTVIWSVVGGNGGLGANAASGGNSVSGGTGGVGTGQRVPGSASQSGFYNSTIGGVGGAGGASYASSGTSSTFGSAQGGNYPGGGGGGSTGGQAAGAGGAGDLNFSW